MGRKMGTKIIIISDHSNGQPSKKIITCAMIRNMMGEISRPVTNSVIICYCLCMIRDLLLPVYDQVIICCCQCMIRDLLLLDTFISAAACYI